MMHDQHELHRVTPGMIAMSCLRATVFFERPNLDAPVLGCRKFRGDPYGVVQVSDIDQQVSAQLFFRFGEGTIGRRVFPSRTRTVVAVSTG